MRRTVFWSWQSDVDAATNRNLIQGALAGALKTITHEDAAVQPVLDRDTAGLGGSPAISDSIFAKIGVADVFVADVTIINPESNSRAAPNPNVLIELGFAIEALGWQRIIMVQNVAYGGPEALPFDLRGHRVVGYELQGGATNKADVRKKLTERLASALRGTLVAGRADLLYAGYDIPLWWGRWRSGSDGVPSGGDLLIYEVGPAGFRFDVSVYHGGHEGDTSGFARIVSPDLAYARIKSVNANEICEISFRRHFSNEQRTVELEEAGDCCYFHGMGAHFAGTFVHRSERLFDEGFLDEIDLQNLYRIAREHYEPLTTCFQLINQIENLDSFDASVLTGGVRGLFTSREAIVMKSPYGTLWAAFIDGDVVRYFTSAVGAPSDLPATIEEWRQRFAEKRVAFHHAGLPIA
jgi:hypothetical protein